MDAPYKLFAIANSNEPTFSWLRRVVAGLMLHEILHARLSLQRSLGSEERRRLINRDQPWAHGIGNVGPGTVHMG